VSWVEGWNLLLILIENNSIKVKKQQQGGIGYGCLGAYCFRNWFHPSTQPPVKHLPAIPGWLGAVPIKLGGEFKSGFNQ
jgi:hypothetical protein